MNQLSDRQERREDPGLDAHVRLRIQVELERLRDEENKVREQIEAGLEKENLEKEKSMTGTSGTLIGDVEEIQSKVNRFQTMREESEGMRMVKERLVSCYK